MGFLRLCNSEASGDTKFDHASRDVGDDSRNVTLVRARASSMKIWRNRCAVSFVYCATVTKNSIKVAIHRRIASCGGLHRVVFSSTPSSDLVTWSISAYALFFACGKYFLFDRRSMCELIRFCTFYPYSVFSSELKSQSQVVMQKYCNLTFKRIKIKNKRARASPSLWRTLAQDQWWLRSYLGPRLAKATGLKTLLI